MSAAYAELVARAGAREEALDRLADVERGLLTVGELRAELAQTARLERDVAEELRTGRARPPLARIAGPFARLADRGRGHPPAA